MVAVNRPKLLYLSNPWLGYQRLIELSCGKFIYNIRFLHETLLLRLIKIYCIYVCICVLYRSLRCKLITQISNTHCKGIKEKINFVYHVNTAVRTTMFPSLHPLPSPI